MTDELGLSETNIRTIRDNATKILEQAVMSGQKIRIMVAHWVKALSPDGNFYYPTSLGNVPHLVLNCIVPYMYNNSERATTFSAISVPQWAAP